MQDSWTESFAAEHEKSTPETPKDRRVLGGATKMPRRTERADGLFAGYRAYNRHGV